MIKKLLFIALLIGFTFGCSNSGKRVVNVNSNSGVKTATPITPTTNPTPDRKAEQVKEVKYKWDQIINPKNQFLDEVKGVKFCTIENRYQEFKYFYEGMPNPKNPKGSYGYDLVTYQDLDLKQEDVLKKYQELTKEWLDALKAEFQKPVLKGCSIGEGGTSYSQYTDITAEIESLVSDSDQAIDFIKAKELRDMWLKAFQKDIALIKNDPEQKSELEDIIRRATEDYKFEEKELYTSVAPKSSTNSNSKGNSNSTSNSNVNSAVNK